MRAMWPLILLFVAAVSGTSAQARMWDVVPAENRNVAAPIPLIVHVRQNVLGIGRDPSEDFDVQAGNADAIANYGVGGVVGSIMGAVIVGAVEKGRAKTAAAEMTPILKELGPFDADRVLMKGIREGISGQTWISLASDKPLREYSSKSSLDALNATASPYLADADCGYAISREFQAIFVRCTISIISKSSESAIGGDGRWSPRRLIYQRSVQSEFAILNFADNRPSRIAQWSGEQYALVRKGLTISLSKAGELVGRQIALTQAEISVIRSKSQKDVAVGYALATDAPRHAGAIIQGLENIDGYKSPGSLAPKAALIRPDTDGIIMLEKTGDIYQKVTSVSH